MLTEGDDRQYKQDWKNNKRIVLKKNVQLELASGDNKY